MEKFLRTFFLYSVETSDGKVHEEHGEIQNLGAENEAIAVQGSYKYIGDDGKPYEVHYTADEHGFQPIGEHIPKNVWMNTTIILRFNDKKP